MLVLAYGFLSRSLLVYSTHACRGPSLAPSPWTLLTISSTWTPLTGPRHPSRVFALSSQVGLQKEDSGLGPGLTDTHRDILCTCRAKGSAWPD